MTIQRAPFFRFALLSLVLAGVLSCQATPPTAVEEAPPAPPFAPVLGVGDLMWNILDPAADGIWDSAGTIITAAGSRELAPTTDEGWEEVVQSAALLAEAGNLLMIPGRSNGAGWNDYSAELRAASQRAMAAAQAQNSDRLFDAGGEIYQACRGCHEKYWKPAMPLGESLPEPKF